MPPDVGFFDAILKAWPAGAALAGFSLIVLFWVKYILPPLATWQRERTAFLRSIEKEKADSVNKARQDELDAEVKIAEAHQVSAISLSNLGQDLKLVTASQQELTRSLAALSSDLKATIDVVDRMQARNQHPGG